MSVKKRIKDFVSEINIPINAFEKSINASNGYVNSITKSIGIDKLERIIEIYPNLDLEWLLTGKGMMLRSSKTDISSLDNEPMLSTINPGQAIPLISTESVPGFVNSEQNHHGIIVKETYVIPEFNEQGAKYLVRVNGSDMHPKFSNGDLLACKPIGNPTFFQWGRVYVLNTNQGTLIKFLYQDEHDKDVLWCRSENEKNYPPFHIHRKNIYNIAIVVGVLRME
ncbi:S24 family peptidase [Pedobacter xixiisoli]|uniref:Phage repressor protein C, contains Cro/C1-type HTH and peptisase s24 domains n=1 Tax=Pedobacter xixiisoli TaxID=1476464 RepID=A0A286AEA5_9SPHI|nr:S24 family peptidase [Pedobacter xixiisoli]SOD20232.1 Phage repressor protein C, contains Cro/C1-type HTH and peptisase s24 domains [Pedobacter xixiisoli]